MPSIKFIAVVGPYYLHTQVKNEEPELAKSVDISIKWPFEIVIPSNEKSYIFLGIISSRSFQKSFILFYKLKMPAFKSFAPPIRLRPDS